jgi:hypothetical protein
MSAKYGYYTDGYFSNNISQDLPANGILVKPKDDSNFVYKFKSGEAIEKFTGRTNLFLQAGGTKGGGINGAYYLNGSLGTGLVDNLFYLNGFLRTGTSNGIYYRSGIPANGVFNNAYYVEGIPSTGLVNNIYYVNGTRGSGYPNGLSPTNVLYKNGNPYRGEIVSKDETNLLSPTLPNRQTIVSAITSNWVGYWSNKDENLTSVHQGLSSLESYWNLAGVPQTINIMLSGGLPFTGVLNNNRIFVNGAPLSGETIFEGRFFRNGNAFTSNLRMSSDNTVTWNGSPVDISSMFITSNTPVLSGSKFFTNGTLAQGLFNITVAANGLRQDYPTYYVNGLKYEALDVTTSGVSGFRDQTLYFYKGVVANGMINGVEFVNGIIK